MRPRLDALERDPKEHPMSVLQPELRPRRLRRRAHARGGAFTSRLATRQDIPAIEPLVQAAIDELQQGFLDDAQIAASRALMGLDSRLIDDGTYYVVECGGRLAGCGGWSRRGAIIGTDGSPGRDSTLLDPARDAARIRAMYTHPDFARRGIGRLILSLAEAAAAAYGFTRLELLATLAGRPLYAAAGYEPIEHVDIPSGAVPVPVIRMQKALSRQP
jgi:GNAT superfamily N-acetyltransferase